MLMPKQYKILIRDSLLEEKRRLRIRSNLKIDDIQVEINNLFESKAETAKLAVKPS